MKISVFSYHGLCVIYIYTRRSKDEVVEEDEVVVSSRGEVVEGMTTSRSRSSREDDYIT